MTEFSPIRQEFNVRYGYDVHFTSGLFREDNLLLLETLATDKKGSPARMLVVVDGGWCSLTGDFSGKSMPMSKGTGTGSNWRPPRFGCPAARSERIALTRSIGS